MQVTKTLKSPTEVLLRISAGSAELAPIHRHVLGHFTKDIKIPGFRAGKAPAKLVEQHVNQKLLIDEFMEHALNDLYRQALASQNVRPVGQTKVEVKKFVPFTELEFEVETEALGKLELADYKNLKLAKPKVAITPKEISNVLKTLQERMAERKEVKTAAKMGDEVVIDFSGKNTAGKPVEGTDGKDYKLLLGSKSFIPGFEEGLVGLKAGASKKLTVTFPKDYGVAAMQNKKVTFAVDVKQVNALDEPKLDDDFATKAGPFKNLAELKEDVKKQLTLERQNQADSEYQNQIVKNITEKSKIDIPKGLVDEQILRAEEEEKRNLAYRGTTWQDHLKEEGVTEEAHRERHRPEIAERVKAGLVLNEISQLEKIEVTPEELEIRLQMLKGQYQDPQMQAELDKPENRDEIAGRIATEKTLDKLVEYASK